LPRPRVKICGITTNEDAILAARLGADAIGLVFYPDSPRAIQLHQVGQIVADLPAFTTVVGLLVDPDAAEVEAILDQGLVQCLQFHGNETARFCNSFGFPYIKAIRVQGLAQAEAELEQFAGHCSVLLDAFVKGTQGGTGSRFDWDIAQALVSNSPNPVILAGGLNAGNVGRAIAQVNPYGVDVSSGVEQCPGIKQADLMRQFFAAVQNSVNYQE